MTDSSTGVVDPLRPWQEPVGRRERCRIRWAGIFDRLRTRTVTDDKMTHYLIALRERAQGFQVEVLKWVSAEETRLEAAIAEHKMLVEQELPDARQAADEPSPSSTKRERAEWASSARVRDQAEADRKAKRQEKAQSEIAIVALMKKREGLTEQRDLHFAACQQWFDERAALYNRARTGLFGLRKMPEHNIPVFDHIDFSTSRPDDFSQIGDGPGEVIA